MNLNEVKKHVYIDILIIVFTIVCFLFTLYVILFQDVNVNASTVETNLTNSISIPPSYSACSQSNGKYWGDNGDSSSSCHVWNKNTTYSGVLYNIEMVLKGGWVVNEPAFINITAMSTDFRNYQNDLYCYIENQSGTSLPCSLTFNSKSLLTISFTPTSAQQNYVLTIASNNGNAITGINTFGIKSVISKQYTGDNQDIINTQNQNTQDIIDSNNDNTQDIINNQDENTQQVVGVMQEGYQKIIDEGQCPTKNNLDWKNYFYSKGYIGSDGNVVSDNTYLHSPYLKLKPNTRYTITFGPNRSGKYACTYLGNQQKQTCYEMSSGPITFTTTNTDGLLLRVSMIVSNNIPVPTNITGPICNNWLLESQQLQKDAVDNVNDYLRDDSDPTINNNDISNTFNSVSVSDPLNYLLTLPLHAIQKINSKLGSNSCSPINLGALYGHNLTLPCINIKAKLGDSLFNTIDILMAIGLLSVTLVKFYNSISNVLTLGKEKEIRERLELPTPMEFLGMIFGGARQ